MKWKLLFVLFYVCMLITFNSINVSGEEKLSLSDLEVGDSFNFGSFEQDNNSSNGPEPINWYVADVGDNEVLLVSWAALEVMPYHSVLEDITWKNCTLRSWLNGEFYETAFNEDEKSRIILSHNSNEMNHFYHVFGGEDTEDFVFVPSIEEFKEMGFAVHASDYAVSKGARGATLGEDFILPIIHLRSPGLAESLNAHWFLFWLDAMGETVDGEYGVVPAIRVRLN